MTADLIKRAQAKLNTLGLGPLKVDGILGPATHTAVEQFQKSRAGLMMTGLLDVATLKALGLGG
jgi:peptidoglycan hydrolase-like protein with peptidoglycan-binding domain